MKSVIRYSLSVFYLVMFLSAVSGQNKFANEWINASKKYYKIKVAENGIFKVTYEELIAAGLPQGAINGSGLKLFNIGKEQAIHVSDNNFGPGSWFEFYGVKNTIGVDSMLFRDWKKDLLNPDYSFITDTNTLTFSPETLNLRYNQVNPDYSNNTLTPLPYYIH